MSETTSDNNSIYMLNALWFKPDGGAEKYQEYAAAATPFLQKLGAKAIDAYVPEVALIGEWDPDLFFLVEYPNKAAFEALLSDEGYLSIAHLREEALDKSLLIQCGKVGLG